MAIQHYKNLSKGAGCSCIAPNARPIRIQSTACEQKLWGKLLVEAGADLLYELARGTTCIIHDSSEQDRETRACWQGLSWIRYACSREWRGAAPREVVRGNLNLTSYWEQQFLSLPASTRRMLAFYGQYHKGHKVRLLSCWFPKPAEGGKPATPPKQLIVQPTEREVVYYT